MTQAASVKRLALSAERGYNDQNNTVLSNFDGGPLAHFFIAICCDEVGTKCERYSVRVFISISNGRMMKRRSVGRD